MSDYPELDLYFPERGPCAFCGHPDARHRVWDAIIDRHQSGESVASIADDFTTTEEAVRAVIAAEPYQGADPEP